MVLDKTTVHSKLAGVELTPGLFHWRVKVEGASPISDRWSQPTIFGVDRKPGAPEIAPLAENPGPEGGTPETFEDDLKAEQELAGQNMEKPQEPEVKPETTVALAKPELVSGEDERLELDFPEADDRSPASMANLSPTNAPKMKWSKVEGAEVYEIEIAENKEFAGKKIYLGSKSDLAFWRDALAGEFFWRVRARSGESVSDFSEIGHFLIDLPAPVVKKETTLSPSDGDEVQHQWGWDPLPRALGYEVVLGSDGSLEEGEVLKVKEAKLDYKFQEGSTYIKVAALGVGDRKVSSYSGVGLVKVVKQLKLNSPKVVRPENGLTIISFGSGSNPVAFGWSEVDKAQSYRIQFSSSADFAEISDEKVIEQTQLVLSSDDFDGEIFWRLRSEAGKNVSAWSAPRHFKTEKK